MLPLIGIHGATYIDHAHRFTFDLPAGEVVEDVPAADSSSETLIISGGADEAQIVITPWSDGGSLGAPESEYPYLLYDAEYIAPTSLAGASGFSFYNQLWVVHAGYLYVLEDVPPIVISSWRF
jgi:hypothetical protein